jgi:hypothetical protein
MNKNSYNVHILVDGNTVKEYTKDGKTFIEAKHGSEYTIKIKNNTARRVLAVVSVDGINVVTGQVATPEDTGYVINGYGSLNLQGYRKDEEGGGRFKFTDKSSGYSKEVDGTGVNSGVIGVTIFPEKYTIHDLIRDSQPRPFMPSPIKPWDDGRIVWFAGNTLGDSGTPIGSALYSTSCEVKSEPSVLRSCTASVNYCATAQAEAQPFDSATTWGSEFKQKIDYVEFERGTESTKIDIYYATRDSLKTLGVIVDTPPAIAFPQSFPGFAKPPVNWKKQ